jgi:hypothetical protein
MPIYCTLIMLLAALMFGPVASAGEKVQIDRSLILRAGSPSNQFPPGAYQILRADDGDYIVSGAVNLSNTEAWATRLDSNGHSRWQFVDGPADAWKNGGSNLNRFYGAIVLPDNSTLLCGTSHLANHQSVALLVYIGTDGKLIKDVHLVPKGFEQASLVSCFKWGAGFGLLGVALNPTSGANNAKAAGWLCKLDFPGKIVWNKFDDNFLSSDVMETPDHNLLVLTSSYKGTHLSKVDREGVAKEGHVVATGAYFMRPTVPASPIRVGYMVDTFHTEFADFDQEMRGPTNLEKVGNVGIKKGYALADGSLLVFGSTYRNNAVPNIALVDKGGQLTNFAVAPPTEAGWINDAAPDGSTNHYVFVRIVGENTVMSWVSVH